MTVILSEMMKNSVEGEVMFKVVGWKILVFFEFWFWKKFLLLQLRRLEHMNWIRIEHMETQLSSVKFRMN